MRKLPKANLNDKKSRTVFVIIRALIIVVLIRSLFLQRWENAFVCVLSLILLLVVPIVEKTFRIEIPGFLERTIYIFIFAAEILGEIGHFYAHFSWWDTMLHTINGFNCAAIGFSMVYILNRRLKSVNLTPLYIAITSFCFSMTIGVIWEFIEHFIDLAWLKDAQKDTVVTQFASTYFGENQEDSQSVTNIEFTEIHTDHGVYIVEGGYLDIGLYDTMEDLFVNMLGAIAFCMIGYYYIKDDANVRIIQNIVPYPMEEENLINQAKAENQSTKKEDSD